MKPKITIEEIEARVEADLAQGKYTVIESPEQLESFLNELEEGCSTTKPK